MHEDYDLSKVKLGDEVILWYGSSWSRDAQLLKVEHTTATLIVAGGVKYKRRGGYIHGGGSWNRNYIRPVTPENYQLMNEIAQERNLKRRINEANDGLKNLKITASNIDAVEAFIATLQSPKG